MIIVLYTKFISRIMGYVSVVSSYNLTKENRLISQSILYTIEVKVFKLKFSGDLFASTYYPLITWISRINLLQTILLWYAIYLYEFYYLLSQRTFLCWIIQYNFLVQKSKKDNEFMNELILACITNKHLF